MVDLRTLAQAYLHAREVDAVSVDLTASREVTRAGLALGAALGTPSTVPPAAHAAAIIAALDAADAAADARGYARAMGAGYRVRRAEQEMAGLCFMWACSTCGYEYEAHPHDDLSEIRGCNFCSGETRIAKVGKAMR